MQCSCARVLVQKMVLGFVSLERTPTPAGLQLMLWGWPPYPVRMRTSPTSRSAWQLSVSATSCLRGPLRSAAFGGCCEVKTWWLKPLAAVPKPQWLACPNHGRPCARATVARVPNPQLSACRIRGGPSPLPHARGPTRHAVHAHAPLQLCCAPNVGALRRSDVPLAAIDFHVSDIVDHLLNEPQVWRPYLLLLRSPEKLQACHTYALLCGSDARVLAGILTSSNASATLLQQRNTCAQPKLPFPTNCWLSIPLVPPLFE